MTLATIKLGCDIHVMHLFYSLDRKRWAELAAGESMQALDEVSARYGEFGKFYITMRMAPPDLWQHLHL